MRVETFEGKSVEELRELELWSVLTMAAALQIPPSMVLALIELDTNSLVATCVDEEGPFFIRPESVYEWLDSRRGMLDRRADDPKLTEIRKRFCNPWDRPEGGAPSKIQ